MEKTEEFEEALHRKIAEEIKNRNELIDKLKQTLRTFKRSEAESLRNDMLNQLKEVEILNTRLDSYIKYTKNEMKKKVAISAEPVVSRTSFVLPRVPKSQRLADLIRTAILSNDFMQHLDSAQVDAIVECMVEVKCYKDDLIIKEGEEGVRVYVLSEGTVEITKDEEQLSTIGPGNVFGELAILFNCTRAVSVKALTKCHLWAIERQSFQQIMMKVSVVRHLEHADFLRTVPRLSKLPEEVLNEITNVLEEVRFEFGDYITRQGSYGDAFFVLSKGTVRVTEYEDGCKEEQEKGTLQTGDYFGELALESDDYLRTANVIVSDPDGAVCLRIDRSSYQKLLRKVIIQDDKYATRRSTPRISGQIDKFASLLLKDLKVVSILGVGGFGKVELVKSEKLGLDKSYALKQMKKYFIEETKQIEHVKNERNILMQTDCNFIIKLHRTFKTTKSIFLLMEACLGGELWTLLRDIKKFNDKTTRFYTACVIEAFNYLHKRGIIYRDLKPENLLIEALGPRKGYVKLTDFGFAKKIGHSKTWTFCGTPEYVAPEIILNKGHDMSADLWSIGILIYELLNGTPPFSNKDHMKTYKQILEGIDAIAFPKKINKSAITIIKKFCRDVPSDRLGFGNTGFRDIQKQRWYSGFNWEGLRNGNMKPPIMPEVSGPTDTRYFEYGDEVTEGEEDIPESLSDWDRDF